MGFLDFWHIALRHKLVIALSFLVVFSGAVVYVLVSKPVYESDCKLLLVDDKGKNSLTDFALDDIMMQTLGKSDPILTQIEILKTRPILEETIRRCNVRQVKDSSLISYDFFVKRFKFDYIKATNLITITYRDNDRLKAPFIVNTLAAVFAQQNQKLNKEEIESAKEFIENQLVGQKKKVEEAEAEVMDFKSKSATVSLDKKTNAQVDAIGNLEAERIRLKSQFRGAEAQMDEIERKLRASGSQAAPYYSSLVASKEMAAINLTNLNAQLRAVNEEIKNQYKNLKTLPPLEIQLGRLMREEQIMNEIYTNLLSKYEEYNIREAAQVASIKLVEPAVVPKFPVFPKKKNTFALAVLMGLFLGFGLAFLIEYLQDRPQSIEEIKKILGTGTLGTVPFFEKSSPLFMIENPSSMQSESIMLVHSNLRFKEIVDKEHIVLMVTSSQPNEGKTTISANLAIAFAKMGKKTTLVNMDLKRPTFEKVFNINFSVGVTDFLIGEVCLDKISYNFEAVPGLTVIPGGQIPPNPTELIGSKKTSELISFIKSSYDVVLIDTAPVTMVAESLQISQFANGIILVSDFSNGSRRSLFALHEILQGKELNILGVVINKIKKEMGGKYGYYGYDKHKKIT
jgi:capsular exopolysaccharide synthesis family protein